MISLTSRNGRLKEVIWQYARAHPELKPAEVLDRCSDEVNFKSRFIEESGTALRAGGIFERAQTFARELLVNKKTPAPNIQRIMEVWEFRPDLSFPQSVELTGGLLRRTLGELKRSGDFETAWNFTRLSLPNSSTEVLNLLREVFEKNDPRQPGRWAYCQLNMGCYALINDGGSKEKDRP